MMRTDSFWGFYNHIKPSLTARLFRFLLLVYTYENVRYNRINMSNKSNKKDEGCVTIFKLKLRKLIEAIERGATVEDVKAELEKLLA